MRLLLTLCISLALTATLRANIIYVNASATGADNGSSWQDAFTDLQNGFTATLPGDSIWVAQGVYKPTTTTNRAISFVLPNGVKVFGGFDGTEVQFSQRNYITNITILSGDIGTIGNASDNTYNIVKTTTVASTTRLDGFKLMLGNGANGPGGGIFNASGSPVIAHCIFEYNQAESGAAISQFNNGGMTVLDCTFQHNTATDNGGAIEIRDGSMSVIGCTFTSNTANLDGGAFYLHGGTVVIDRSTISGNSAAFIGGAIYGYYFSTLQISNSLIVGNQSATSSAIYFPPLSNTNSHTVLNCTIADNLGASSGASDCVTLNANSEISNCIFYGNRDPREIYPLTGSVNYSIVDGGFTGSGANQIFTANPGFVSPGNYLLAPFDAALYNYHVGTLSAPVDAGNNSYVIPTYMSDLDSNSRIHTSTVDLGCYENTYCSFTVLLSSPGNVSVCPDSSIIVSVLNGNFFLWSDSSNLSSLAITAPGTYVVRVDSGGCLGIDSVTVVNYTAQLIISGNTNLCDYDSTILSVTGNATSISWNTSDTTTSIVAYSPGTYFAAGTTVNGCIVSDTILVISASGPVPVVSYSSGTLSTTSFSSYQWLLNGVPVSSATSAQYVPIQNGNYSVIVTNSFGCIDTSGAVMVNDVGIDENAFIPVTTYPNPCSDKIVLSGAALSNCTQIAITDYQGRILFVQTIQIGMSYELSTEFLASGSYLIVLTGPEHIYRVPILKN